MSDSYSLCFYVFLVACNEHIIACKIRKKTINAKKEKEKDQMSINKQTRPCRIVRLR